MLPIQSCFEVRGTYVFFNTCIFFRLGQAPEIFFRKISVKKKIGPLSRAKIFFFKKSEKPIFSAEIYQTVFFPSRTCFGSGPTWHMAKIIFKKKNPFDWEKYRKVLGSILRSSVKE